MSDRPDTRKRLVEAAAEVIDCRGEAALRVSEVAAMVGVKEPSIYHFFANREQLVVAAHGLRFRRSLMQAVAAFSAEASSASTVDEFRASVQRVLDFVFAADRRGVRAARVSVFGNALARADLLREVNDASYEANVALAEVLSNAQRKGWIRSDVSLMTIAVWLQGQVLGRFLVEMDGDRYDGAEWNRLATESVFTAFFSPQP